MIGGFLGNLKCFGFGGLLFFVLLGIVWVRKTFGGYVLLGNTLGLFGLLRRLLWNMLLLFVCCLLLWGLFGISQRTYWNFLGFVGICWDLLRFAVDFLPNWGFVGPVRIYVDFWDSLGILSAKLVELLVPIWIGWDMLKCVWDFIGFVGSTFGISNLFWICGDLPGFTWSSGNCWDDWGLCLFLLIRTC